MTQLNTPLPSPPLPPSILMQLIVVIFCALLEARPNFLLHFTHFGCKFLYFRNYFHLHHFFRRCHHVKQHKMLADITCRLHAVFFIYVFYSVADVFGPPGFVSQRYGSCSGSRSFYQVKIVRKPLIPTVLWLLKFFMTLKKDVIAPSKSSKKKILEFLLLPSWRSLTKKAGCGSVDQWSGSVPETRNTWFFKVKKRRKT